MSIKKECKICLEVKQLTDFANDKHGYLGRKAKCKACQKQIDIANSRTLVGYIRRLYNAHTSNSKARGYGYPDYNKQELKDWLTSNDEFNKLLKFWKANGYKTCDRPSVDRVDDYIGYTFSNIQIMTFRENREKGDADRVNGVNTKMSRAVNQYDMDGNFIRQHHSLASAGRSIGGNYNISSCCSGKHKHIKGFIWRYADECRLRQVTEDSCRYG